MTEQERARKQSRSKRDKQQEGGHEEEVVKYEKELARYLQERIKPGLNRGAIPLLARSIAKEIARRGHTNGASENAAVKDQPSAEREAPPDFEDEMHDLQAELGQDWILRFSVQGDDGWLTAEKDDGSQRVEAPTAAVIYKAVKLLNKGGGRST